MFASNRFLLNSKAVLRKAVSSRQAQFSRFKSTSAVVEPNYNEDGNVPRRQVQELVHFPGGETKPVLLNSQEHVVGYLSKILNARVYDAAIETDLQEAKNLSAVSFSALFAVISEHRGHCSNSSI